MVISLSFGGDLSKNNPVIEVYYLLADIVFGTRIATRIEPTQN